MHSHINWARATIGWHPDGTVLYVEHYMSDRTMTTFIPRLQGWFASNHDTVEVVAHSGYRKRQDEQGTHVTMGMLNLRGPKLMQIVDPVLLRETVDKIAGAAELRTQQQIDQEEKHRGDWLAALRREPGEMPNDA